MTLVAFLRPVLPATAALLLAACGGAEADPHRFETMANHVAAIDLSPGDTRPAPRSAAEAGLRPADARPLRVELMTPHELWDARDGVQRAVLTNASPAEPLDDAASPEPSTDLRPAAPMARTAVQLGAYGSEASAREAWARLKDGAAAAHLKGLKPVYQPVEVNGRRLVRLKVEDVSSDRAAGLCASVAANDPWCAGSTTSTRASTGAA